jgi:hypothetical protein
VISAHPEFKAVVKALTPIEYDMFAEKEVSPQLLNKDSKFTGREIEKRE